ncbi:acetamidase/formamidase family protein [Hydrogenispora sp. UU3]|uniref:Acetamidase/formamidase family protein n=1 Tax=Capillibacterium thermochitinicola TaxID=2699427 RepID=A0A8J6HTV7_9FIRM|nr:acetamidase/formamidase family protein [Capillibacterium thermochitinicola]
MRYQLSGDHHIFSFDKENKPVLQVNPGEEVEIETMDCFANQICTDDDKLETLDWQRVNPATGPVFVNGAEPGDVLKVTIQAQPDLGQLWCGVREIGAVQTMDRRTEGA